MPWDRGAWEKTTSRGVPYSKYNDNYGERINGDSGSSVNVSGGISFCPECGSMMMSRDGALRCSQCGYVKYSNKSSNRINRQNRVDQQERRRKENEKRQKIKDDMNRVLRYMRQGKTRAQASSLSGIPLSRISNWYNEGKEGYGRDNVHFYHEVSYIEENQERRKRDEINRQNRLKEQERKKREQRQKRERLQKQSQQDTIKKQMDEIIKQMKNGETRSQAAMNVGVPVYRVDEWYDMGWRRKKEPYTTFYNKVNTIEIRRKKKSSTSVKSKTVNTTNISKNKVKQMEEIVKYMRQGLNRSEAAEKLNLNPVTVNNWYNKGSHGDLDYVKFYNNVKSIENSRKKYTSSSKNTSTTSNMVKCPKCSKMYNNKYNLSCPHCKKKNKIDSTSNFIKCPECGKFYSKSKSSCPHCTSKSTALVNVNYCQNCGKKITDSDLNYCSQCGSSLIKVDNTSKAKTKINKSTSSNCCMGLMVSFIIIAILMVII